MLAALRWLYQNPEAHIGANIAVDASGRVVSTLSDQATCFCAVGRYAVESGIDISSLESESLGMDPESIEHEAELDAVWETNDLAFIFEGDYLPKAIPVSESARVKALVSIGGHYNISSEDITTA